MARGRRPEPDDRSGGSADGGARGGERSGGGERDHGAEGRDRRGPGWWPEGAAHEPSESGDPPEGEGERPGPGGARRRRRPRRGPGLGGEGPARPARRYSTIVGLAFVVVIVIAFVNLLGSEDTGILGAGYGSEAMALPEFAVPDARLGIDKDANISQDDCESSRNPCPADQRRTPACRIDAPGAIRVCDLFDRPLAISFWFTRGGDCLPSQDAFDAVARRFRGRVNFLSVNVRDDPERVAEIVAERGWRVPVGLDRDGAVSNLYRVGVCPTIVYAYPGGLLQRAGIRPGNYGEEQIAAQVKRLLAASRERLRGTS